MDIKSWKIPLANEPTIQTGEFDVPTVVKYDEIIYDYRTRRYLTVSQEQEIYKLKDQLNKQQEEKRQKLKHLIGYYYKNYK